METHDRYLQRASPERRREIARLGGLAVQRTGRAHRWTSEEASAAARSAIANTASRKALAAAVDAGTAMTQARTPDRWLLLGRDGRLLECRIQIVAYGFEVCAGYPGVMLMTSEIYPDLPSARAMLEAWWDAALAGGNFVKLPQELIDTRDHANAND
jgi:hypothetical protein